ncbi:MAG: 3-dehydroquinate synthase [Bilifractor sp.]|nr:3-dehydroquinate synthase [Bilifractor sp.]
MESLIVERKSSGMEFSYQIVWESSFQTLADEIRQISGFRAKKICVVSDSNVAPLYAGEVEKALAPLGLTVETYVFPAGEEHKCLDTVIGLYRFLIEHKFQRNDILAALGGGVAGDLTGFAAATYLRGIDFIQIPTTLLAQVDSSVGGKTGVDFEQYKNMVGAFLQPRLVYMNMKTLKTLPQDQFASGMGEVLKTGAIRDRNLLTWIDSHEAEILRRDPDALATVIRACCRVKASVVEEDPKDKGLRAILNFGHTLGHAIEKCKNFELLHGQCVGIGSIGASWLSMKRGMISEEDYRWLQKLHRDFGIPTSVSGLTVDEIVRTTRSDKKMEEGHIRFILLDGVGNAVIDSSVTDEELREAASVLIK